MEVVRRGERIGAVRGHRFVDRSIVDARIARDLCDDPDVALEFGARLPGKAVDAIDRQAGIGDVRRAAEDQRLGGVTGREQAVDQRGVVAAEAIGVEGGRRQRIAGVVEAIEDRDEVGAVAAEEVAPVAGKTIVGARAAGGIGRILQDGRPDPLVGEADPERSTEAIGPAALGSARGGAGGDRVAEDGERGRATAPALDKARHRMGSTNSSTIAAVQLKRPPPSGLPSRGS